MKKRLLIIALILMININLILASAEIFFNDEFEEIYVYGDEIDFDFSIEKQQDTFGYVEVFVECENEDQLVYKNPAKLEMNKKKNFHFEWTSNLEGEECKAKIEFEEEDIRSESFEISKTVDLEANLNNRIFYPTEQIVVNGSAEKKNGDKLEGFALIYVEDIINETVDINEGRFLHAFEIKSDAKPGIYELKIEVIEKNTKKDIVSRGIIEKDIEIEAKPTSFKIKTSAGKGIAETTIKPPKNETLIIELLDQAGNKMVDEEIIIKIYDPKGKRRKEETVTSGETIIYEFKKNDLRGAWKINLYYGKLFEIKQIYIGEHKDIDISIAQTSEGTSLRIKNVGNIDYEGNIEIEFLALEKNLDDTIKRINVSIPINEERDYLLNITEGKYNVSIGEWNLGETNIFIKKDVETQGSGGITGAAINLEGIITNKSYIITFIILILIIISYYYLRKKDKTLLFMEIKRKTKRLIPRISVKKKKRKKIRKVRKEDSLTIDYKPTINSGKDNNINDEEKRAYTTFFYFDKYLSEEDKEDLERISRENKITLKSINNRYYFTLFYSKLKDIEIGLIDFARELKNHYRKKGIGISIIINSCVFRNKASSIRSVLSTKNLVQLPELRDKIIITQGIYEKILEQKKFRIKEYKDFSTEEERFIRTYIVN